MPVNVCGVEQGRIKLSGALCQNVNGGPCPPVIFIYYRLYKVWPAALFRV